MSLGWDSRRLWRRMLEVSWLLPVLGALAGALLAATINAVEGPAEATDVAVTVDRVRASVWNSLALLFTGLSVVMAVVTLTAQNLASRFSPRLLRVKLLKLSERLILFAFSFTTSYILTVLFVQRGRLPDDPVGPATLAVGLLLIVGSAVALVVYVNRLLQSIRVDRTVRWVGRLIEGAARTGARTHRHDVQVAASAFEPPPGAVAVPAHSSGYVVGVDIAGLHTLAIAHDAVLAVTVETGQLVVTGDVVGWMKVPGAAGDLPAAVAGYLELDLAQDPGRDVAYDVGLLIDMALMALSPAVNDPHTAVQCIDQLTLILASLAEQGLGPRGRPGADGQPVVLVARRTLGETVEHFAERILLYGASDPLIDEALSHLVHQLEYVATTEDDRHVAQELSGTIARSSEPMAAPR